jgi:hypothetical protein
MAKSFKKEPATGSARPKPTSERDFFDFLEDPTAELSAGPAGSEPVAALPGAAEPVPNSNTSKQVLTESTPVTQQSVSPPEKPAPAPDAEPSCQLVAKPAASSPRRRLVTKQPDRALEEPAGIAASPVTPPLAATAASIPGPPAVESNQGVRQTFVVGAQSLEQLRDFVHARRASGDYWYSQRQAIEEGLALLFATRDPVTQRPYHIQAREQEQRVRIQQGRRVGRAPKHPPSSP